MKGLNRVTISLMTWNLTVTGSDSDADADGVRETEERVLDAIRTALVGIGTDSATFTGQEVGEVDLQGEREIGQEGRADAPDMQRSPTSQPGVSVDPDGTVHDVRDRMDGATDVPQDDNDADADRTT